MTPALGLAPSDAPQPGTLGGGGLPETDLYAKSLAPLGSVPVAVFPPFGEYKRQATKCVIYSERTDFEKNFTNTGDYDDEVCQLCSKLGVDYIQLIYF